MYANRTWRLEHSTIWEFSLAANPYLRHKCCVILCLNNDWGWFTFSIQFRLNLNRGRWVRFAVFEHNFYICPPSRYNLQYLTDPFAILELGNPSHDVHEPHKCLPISWYRGSQIVKGLVGYLINPYISLVHRNPLLDAPSLHKHHWSLGVEALKLWNRRSRRCWSKWKHAC